MASSIVVLPLSFSPTRAKTPAPLAVRKSMVVSLIPLKFLMRKETYLIRLLSEFCWRVGGDSLALAGVVTRFPRNRNRPGHSVDEHLRVVHYIDGCARPDRTGISDHILELEPPRISAVKHWQHRSRHTNAIVATKESNIDLVAKTLLPGAKNSRRRKATTAPR